MAVVLFWYSFRHAKKQIITRTPLYRFSWLVVVTISFSYAFNLIVNAFNDWALSPAVIHPPSYSSLFTIHKI